MYKIYFSYVLTKQQAWLISYLNVIDILNYIRCC